MISRKRKIFGYFILFLLLLNLLILVSGHRYLYKAIWYNFVDITDYSLFENRSIERGVPQEWPVSTQYNKIDLSDTLLNTLEKLQSVAFLVIKDDSIIIEKYWDNYSDSSLSNSFSMAKSYVATLIGFALQEGKITSLQDPLIKYLPQISGVYKEKVTIEDVLKMSSGSSWAESYTGPFSITTKAYYGTDLPQLMATVTFDSLPGQKFKYLSGDTQILAMVLEKVTGKILSEYASEKMWKPMGYSQNALWSLDHKDGVEKAYCCINSNARDFARIVKLYLNKGNWNGNQLLDSNFVKRAISKNPYPLDSNASYGYQWWLYPNNKLQQKIFYSRGILGQYAIGIPEKNIIIVRLGHRRGEKDADNIPAEFPLMIEEINKMF